MKVQILEEATADLADGYRFYERQTEGLGEYFLDSLWSRCKFVGILLGGIRSDRTRFLRKPFWALHENLWVYSGGIGRSPKA